MQAATSQQLSDLREARNKQHASYETLMKDFVSQKEAAQALQHQTSSLQATIARLGEEHKNAAAKAAADYDALNKEKIQIEQELRELQAVHSSLQSTLEQVSMLHLTADDNCAPQLKVTLALQTAAECLDPNSLAFTRTLVACGLIFF